MHYLGKLKMLSFTLLDFQEGQNEQIGRERRDIPGFILQTMYRVYTRCELDEDRQLLENRLFAAHSQALFAAHSQALIHQLLYSDDGNKRIWPCFLALLVG